LLIAKILIRKLYRAFACLVTPQLRGEARYGFRAGINPDMFLESREPEPICFSVVIARHIVGDSLVGVRRGGSDCPTNALQELLIVLRLYAVCTRERFEVREVERVIEVGGFERECEKTTIL
jgi:hypothetical protein